ncbi:MAG: trans-aconitate 2-methyltransferase, partial [Pseudomonadota bacterium]|nr:trans-aconitate 2-methyltransferase [Pseudomonadota bacterium]
PGNSTELLAARWPEAEVIGTDSSEAMLESARERLPRLRFERSDIATWQPAPAPELVYANAALQWVADHAGLFPRLFASLAPGGVLAVQMPDNLDQPSHQAMREVATMPAFAASIGKASAVRSRILPATGYYDLLARDASSVDIWRTTYHHPMPSARAIVDWLRSTGLRPFVDRLSDALRARFLDEYESRIAAAYPECADGLRLLIFPRLFIVARRKG